MKTYIPYIIGAIVMLVILAMPVALTEQGRTTVSCMVKTTSPEFSGLEWEWCVWAMHDLDDMEGDGNAMDRVQFQLHELLYKGTAHARTGDN